MPSCGLQLSGRKMDYRVWPYGKMGYQRLNHTQQQAEEWLIVDCNQVIKLLRSEYIGPLRQCQVDALVSLGFNIGTEALQTSTLMKKLKKNPDDPSIIDEFRRWVYVKGAVSQGLVRRRKAEAEMYAGR